MIKNIKNINILGKVYKIEFVDKPSDVDIYKRESLWGQIDYWTRSIRIFRGDRLDADLFETLVHEIFHGIVDDLKIASLYYTDYDKKKHDDLGIMAIAFADVLTRNHLVIID